MSITDFRQARREDENARAEREIARQAAQREQDRADARERFEQQQAAADHKAERERQEQEQQKKAKAEARRAAKARRAERRQKLTDAAGWARANGDVSVTLLVMACGMVPALISQYSALRSMQMGVMLSALLPVMLELAAWAMTFGEARAIEERRNPRAYQVGVWLAASLAAGVNALHGWTDYAPSHRVAAAVILAASSIVPVWLWHRVMAGRHARTTAEIEDEQRRAEHAARRRADHPEVARLADTLISAAPFGELPEERAFAKAWALLHGDVPGMTADLRACEVQARVRIAAASKDTPDAVVGRLLANLGSTPAKTPQKLAKASKPGRTNTKDSQVSSSNPLSPKRGKSAPRGRQVDAARKAAADTAKASDPAVKAKAVDWIADRLRTGQGVHWKDDVQPEFPFSRAWIYARIKEAQARVDGENRPALRAVGGGE